MTVWGPLDNLLQENAQLQADLAAAREREQRLMTVIEDAVQVGEMQGEDFRLMPWSTLSAAIAAAAPAAVAQEPRGEGIPVGVELDSPTWPLVLLFAVEMEIKLAQNRHKGNRSGWLHDSPESLIERIGDEFGELCEAIGRRDPSQHVYREAADVANFAMMTADSYGYAVGKGLLERQQPPAGQGSGDE